MLQPPSLQRAVEVERVRAARPDALVVAAYGLILPQALLEAGPHGALNIHASLLPRWRGAAPIQRALLAGDSETGISIMQMDAGLDTGPVLQAGQDAHQRRRRRRRACTTGSPSWAPALIVEALAEVEAARAVSVSQPKLGMTYARKIDKRETRLDWTRPATELERAVRAFRPAPGASTRAGGVELKIWRVRVVDGRPLAPGESDRRAGRRLRRGRARRSSNCSGPAAGGSARPIFCAAIALPAVARFE